MEKQNDYIQYRIERANETYEDAILLAENGKWNSAVNRLYYAAFYIVSALLASKNIDSQTHNGVKTQFFKHFIKEGPLDKSFSILYTELFESRQEGDYEDFINYKEEAIRPMLPQVKDFIQSIITLIEV